MENWQNKNNLSPTAAAAAAGTFIAASLIAVVTIEEKVNRVREDPSLCSEPAINDSLNGLYCSIDEIHTNILHAVTDLRR